MGRRRVPGGTTDRGYGVRHQELRRRLLVRVAWGVTPCARCGAPLASPASTHLDHADGDRRGYIQSPFSSLPLSHASCNSGAPRRKRIPPPPVPPPPPPSSGRPW